MSNVWVVIDVGCHECGVDSEPVGIYATEAEANAAQETRDRETNGLREGGLTIARVFKMTMPDVQEAS